MPLDVGHREAASEPSLDDVVLGGAAALLHLDDVVAEVGLHRIGDLPDRERFRGVFERLHELTLADPGELAAGVPAPPLLRIALGELLPQVLAVGCLTELSALGG